MGQKSDEMREHVRVTRAEWQAQGALARRIRAAREGLAWHEFIAQQLPRHGAQRAAGAISRMKRRLRADEARALRGVLALDVVSEFDARLLSAHLRGLDLAYTPTFLEFERLWAEDERRHFWGFRGVFARCFGERISELTDRAADFRTAGPPVR